MTTDHSRTTSTEVNQHCHGVPHLLIHRDAVMLFEQGKLTATEVLLLATVDALVVSRWEGCWATNEYLAKRMGGITKSSVSHMLSKMEKMKLIIQKGWKKTKHGSVRMMETAYSHIIHDENIYGKMTRGGASRYRRKKEENTTEEGGISLQSDTPIALNSDAPIAVQSDDSTDINRVRSEEERRERKNASRPQAARSLPSVSFNKRSKDMEVSSPKREVPNSPTNKVVNDLVNELRETLRHLCLVPTRQKDKKYWEIPLGELIDAVKEKNCLYYLNKYKSLCTPENREDGTWPTIHNGADFKRCFVWLQTMVSKQKKEQRDRNRRTGEGNFYDDPDEPRTQAEKDRLVT